MNKNSLSKLLPLVLALFIFLSIKIIHLIISTIQSTSIRLYAISFILVSVVIIVLICLIVQKSTSHDNADQFYTTNITTDSNQEIAVTMTSHVNTLDQNILMQCLLENWTHARHVEMEKLYFTSMYAVVIGAILTSLVSLKSSSSINYPLFNALIYFSMLFTTLGLLLSIKWSKVFDDHIKLAKETAKSLDSNILKYINLPNSFRENPRNNSTYFFNLSKFTRTKHMFYYFYVSIFIMLIFLLTT